jgi:hypothetical protein
MPKEEAKKEAEFILSIGSVRKELSIIKYIWVKKIKGQKDDYNICNKE